MNKIDMKINKLILNQLQSKQLTEMCFILEKVKPCNSCRLRPKLLRGQNRWSWRNAGWRAARCGPPGPCAQSSSPPGTAFPRTPGASAPPHSPLTPGPWGDNERVTAGDSVFLGGCESVSVRTTAGERVVWGGCRSEGGPPGAWGTASKPSLH